MNIFTQKLTSIMTWPEFIKKIRAGLFGERFSDVELANKIGSSREVIYKLRIGGKRGTQEPRSITKNKIEKAFNIKIDDSDPEKLTYRLTGQENDLIGNELQLNQKKIIYNSFPVVTVVRAGQPNGVREDDVLYYAEFNYTKREGVVAVLVEGDSMEPELKHGDIVLIDKYADPISDNIVVAVFENNEHTIKKYRVLTEDLIELLPANKNYQSLIVKKSKLSAIYKVVRSLRSH